MSMASQENPPVGAIQLPEQKAFFKIPARFGHVPVAKNRWVTTTSGAFHNITRALNFRSNWWTQLRLSIRTKSTPSPKPCHTVH